MTKNKILISAIIIATISLIATLIIGIIKNSNNNANSTADNYNMNITFTKETYDTLNETNTRITNNSRTIPNIIYKENQKVADKIEESLISISNEEWINIKKNADEITNDKELVMEDETQLGATLNYSFLTNNNYQRQTFYLSLEGNFGGVNWYNYWGYNYDLKTGDLLTLKTITNDYETLNKLINDEVERKLKELKNINIIENDPEIINNLINKTGNWMFTKDGIDIIFQKYEIADGASGEIIINIDSSLINEYLKDEYKF